MVTMIDLTPEFSQKDDDNTPPVPSKKGKKSKRKIKKKSTKKNLQGAMLSGTKRERERVEKSMEKNQERLKKKRNTKKRGDYDVYDVRRGLWMMVKGSSARQAEKDTNVPERSLRRNFVKCLGFNHSKHSRISRTRRDVIEKKIANYELQSWGGAYKKVLLKDEEELIVCAAEFASKHCFPWSPHETTKLAWTMMRKIDPDAECPGRGWLRGFEKRWQHRLQRCKTSSIDPIRAKQATAEVRDEIYRKYVEFHDDLVERGEITQEQLTHFEDFILNIDEVGGDELGKRIRCYQPAKANKSILPDSHVPNWRNIEIGGDHNPFHVTNLFGTIANGTIAPFWTTIHSQPGCKSKRVRAALLEGLPGGLPRWQILLWPRFFLNM